MTQFCLLSLQGSHTSPDIPILIVGTLLLTASIMIYFLPDVLHRQTPHTIAEVENDQLKNKMELENV